MIETVVRIRAGRVVAGGESLREPPGATPEERSVAQLARSYGAALARWNLAGRPLRSAERIEEILGVCRSCPAFREDGGRPRCGYCGCSVNNRRDGVRNKVAMATEACPHPDGPRWAADAGGEITADQVERHKLAEAAKAVAAKADPRAWLRSLRG